MDCKDKFCFICPQCSFKNQETNDKCEICGAPNLDFIDDAELPQIIEFINSCAINSADDPFQNTPEQINEEIVDNTCVDCHVIHDGKSCAEYLEEQNKIYFACPKCTFKNDLSCERCEMCDTPNPDFIEDAELPGRIVLINNGTININVNPDNVTNNNNGTNVQTVAKFNDDCFECAVCFLECKPGDGIVLKACSHPICKACLQDIVKCSSVPNIKCHTCSGMMQEYEIRAAVDHETYCHYMDISLGFAAATIPNTFHCRRPDCAWWCIYPDGVNELTCDICGYSQLIREPCAEDVICDELIARGEAMTCPGCDRLVEKSLGCDYLQCPTCETGMCWATRGPRWGPNGPGDNSGGCGCKVGGVKCHPDCNDCH